MEYVVCSWFHAVWEKCAERVVVFLEQRVKERKKIQCGVAVGQDVQGAREEEEACDVLAQGVEASQDHITHQRQRGNQRQHFGRKSFDGARGLSAILCSNLNEPNLQLISAKATPACPTTRTN